jgi:type 1 fimbriae regulatory protein FimE
MALFGEDGIPTMNKVIPLQTRATRAPHTVNGKVPPRRRRNREVRSREYLTEKVVAALIHAARKAGRHGYRDATLILLSYRHAPRVSEAIAVPWEQLDLSHGLLHVNRNKNGTPSSHPLGGPEIRALRRLQRDYPETPYVFVTERKGLLTTSSVRKIVTRAGQRAGIAFPIHPHMLRHACGFKLANEGRDTRSIQLYLGHTNIQHTTVYTELAPNRFDGFWKD